MKNKKLKKRIYLALTIILVFLLGLLLYAMIEAAYIKEVLSAGKNSANICSFGFLWKETPLWLRFFIILVGTADGYFLGQYWWRMVYIEKKHWRFRKKAKKTKKKKI